MNEMRNPYMPGRQDRMGYGRPGCSRMDNRPTVPYQDKGCDVCDKDRNDRNRNERERTDRNRNMQGTCDWKKYAQNVYELGFVMIETALYLDTHPNDAEALAYYAEMKEKYHEAVRLYTENVGPLDIFNVPTENNYWTWVATPMPWEVEG